MIRTRFSPSPTGLLHLGNARTALFSALYAQSQQGKFVLRIEDTDATRSEEQFVTSLQHDLRWLGIEWQEGPEVGGAHEPYFQSKRHAIYEKYYQQLIDKKLAYPCFCTDQELALNRKIQLSRGQAPRYPGTCRELSVDDIQKRKDKGLKPALRFRVVPNTVVEFTDLVKGPQRFSSDDIGDFIIRRADGSSSFLFCNAIDDALMEITHVIRGEDHLTNTPRQMLILRELQLTAPHYAHLSMILGDDGSPLSKRHGSFGLHDVHQQGYLPLAVINYLARLSHTYEEQRLFDFKELAQAFRLDKLSRSPARFDLHQLLFWQKSAVMQLTEEAAWQWLGKEIQQAVPVHHQHEFITIMRANVCFPKEAEKWLQIFFHPTLTFTDDNKTIVQNAGKNYFAAAEKAVAQYGVDMKQVFDSIKQQCALSGKALFMPMRIALTGEQHGPEMIAIAAILGKEIMLMRLQHAAQLIQ